MAVGEFISVSSQRDAEMADLAIEAEAIAHDRSGELRELAKIYEQRGVEPGLARLVAEQLMAHDELGAHARDELGITEISSARPGQAAWISALAFTLGGLIPLLSVILPGRSVRIPLTAAVSLLALIGLGGVGRHARRRAPFPARRYAPSCSRRSRWRSRTESVGSSARISRGRRPRAGCSACGRRGCDRRRSASRPMKVALRRETVAALSIAAVVVATVAAVSWVATGVGDGGGDVAPGHRDGALPAHRRRRQTRP